MNKKAQEYIWALFIVMAVAILAIFVAMPIEYKIDLIKQIEGNNTTNSQNMTENSEGNVIEVNLQTKEITIGKNLIIGEGYMLLPIEKQKYFGGEYSSETIYISDFSLASTAFDNSKGEILYKVSIPRCTNTILKISGDSNSKIYVKVNDNLLFYGNLNGNIEFPLPKREDCKYDITIGIDQPIFPFFENHAKGKVVLYEKTKNKILKKLVLPYFDRVYLEVYSTGKCIVEVNNNSLPFDPCIIENYDISSYMKVGENTIGLYSPEKEFLHYAVLKVYPNSENEYDILLNIENLQKIKKIELFLSVEEGEIIVKINNQNEFLITETGIIDLSSFVKEGYNIVTISSRGLARIREIKILETYLS